MPRLRLLPERCESGAMTMALDEALLGFATVPTLRLYTWSEPTISLGYFQDHDRVRALLPATEHPLPIVRRITGGGAIWHDQEVTYCLVGRLGRDLPARVQDLYPLLHGAILAELTRLGAPLVLQRQASGDRRYRDEPRCFASPAVDDLTNAAGGKVLGSAARQRGEALLMHGSLKLSSNPWDGTHVASCGADPHQARTALLRGISQALGLDLEESGVTSQEVAEAQRICEVRYASDAWVVHRRGPRP